VLVVNPIPLAEETDPNEELGHFLRNYQEQHPQGSILDSTLPQRYVYMATSRRLADRLIWTGLGRAPDRQRDVVTIAVEFVSRGKRNRRRDYEEKRREYFAIGIREYWIIDRFERKMTVIAGAPAAQREQVVAEHETYTTPLLPGFELPLGHILALADRWHSSRKA
jgi:Uma2 family endonuclease